MPGALDPRVEYLFIAPESRAGADGDTDPAPDVDWSERALAAIEAAYGTAGPELVEFCDYRGDAIAALRARARDRSRLARSTIAVRAHTTFELAMMLKGVPLRDGSPIAGIERQSLRSADVLLWAGGSVRDTYERFYGASALPPAERRIRYPVRGEAAAFGAPPAADDGRLRILYLGRFDRLKGVAELAAGFAAVRSDGWRLTMVGGDTASAPGGGSMREYVRDLTAADPRIATEEHADRARIAELLADHDLVVVPSRYEAWGYVALEALAANRPVLASPVGGLARDRRRARRMARRELQPERVRERPRAAARRSRRGRRADRLAVAARPADRAHRPGTDRRRLRGARRRPGQPARARPGARAQIRDCSRSR